MIETVIVLLPSQISTLIGAIKGWLGFDNSGLEEIDESVLRLRKQEASVVRNEATVVVALSVSNDSHEIHLMERIGSPY